MTPLTPNPPGPKSLLQGQNQSFDVSPVKQDCPVLFNFLDQFQENHDPKEHKLVSHYGGSSSSTNHQQPYNSSSDSAMVDQSIARDTNLSSSMEVEDSSKRNDPLEEKWKSSKMRLMKILMIPQSSYGAATNEDKAIINTTASDATTPSNGGIQNDMYNQGSPTARVCVECQATSTPLWRSGPKGPKSLCNACGIRQRKARRAVAEAGSSWVTSTKMRGLDNEKEKKLVVNKCTQFKKKNKNTSTSPTAATTTTTGSSSSDEMTERLNFFLLKVRKKSGYEDTTEEVADTALLLMDISSGYVYP
ncbi:hypothetical protein RYX36_022561 [Vicia faba]